MVRLEAPQGALFLLGAYETKRDEIKIQVWVDVTMWAKGINVQQTISLESLLYLLRLLRLNADID